jgi:hypothetical protein
MLTQTETTITFCTERNKATLVDLAKDIKTCARDAAESSHDALKSAIAAGILLVKAKDKVLYGKWLPWLRQNFEFSQSTASQWMRLAENRVELLDLIKDVGYVSVQDALKLISDNPAPPPKTKFQKVKKRCKDLIKELYSQTPAEARRSKDLLLEHIEEVNSYLKEYT